MSAKLKLLYPTIPNYYKGKPFFHINQHFGENAISAYASMGLKGHNGLDLFAVDGLPVYASHDGVVTYAGEDGAGGLTLVIRSNEEVELLDRTCFIKTIYCHLKKGSFLVKPTDKVVEGQKVAEADNTGLSSNTHLHFGLKPIYKGEADWQWFNVDQENGYKGAIDPEPYLYFKEIFTKILTQGITDPDVERLQRLLAKFSFFNYPSFTDYYGKETARAVLAFQKANKVASLVELMWLNGSRVGEKTLTALNKVG